MEIKLGQFGSVFENKDNLYVYFGWTPQGDRLFAGKILDNEQSKLLQKMSDKYETKINHPMQGSITLCFVVLTTNDFKGQATYFNRVGDNIDVESKINFLNKSLNEPDIKQLKKIILEDNAIPKSLKDIVKALE